MAIQLSNKTDEQLEKEVKEAGLIPKGAICDTEVLESVTFGSNTIYTADSESKAGNDMIVLVTKVYHQEGFKIIVDYLTANNERMEFKLRHAMNSYGVGGNSVSAKSFIGKYGKVKVGIQKDKEGKYPDKNTIQDYVPKATATTEELDDSIPTFL